MINVGGEAELTVATSMNYVDGSNLEEAAATLLEEAEVHPRYRSRLRKGGVAVPASQARWYERFRMAVESAEVRRLSAVVQHVQQEAERPDEAFLEPWPAFARRPWNLRRADEAERSERSG